jgi:hypothetical protein
VKALIVILLLVGLAVGCSGNSNKAEVVSAAAPAATPEKPAMTPEEKAMSLAIQGKKWARVEHEDKMDGHKWASFLMYPADYVSPDPTENTHLVVLCNKSHMDMGIQTGPRTDGAVRIRFDNGPVVPQSWHKFEGDWFPSAAEKKAILNGLATAKLFKYEYSAVDKAHQILTFNVADYRESVLADPLCHK